MAHQGDTIEQAAFAADTEFLRDIGVAGTGIEAELVPAGGVGYRYIRFKEVRSVGGVNTGRQPPLPEIEVQLIKGNGLRGGFAQGSQRFQGSFVTGMVVDKRLYFIRFGNNVAGDKLIGDFVTAH